MPAEIRTLCPREHFRFALLLVGQVGQVRTAHRGMAHLDRGVRLLAGLDALQEVVHVRLGRDGSLEVVDRRLVFRPRLLVDLEPIVVETIVPLLPCR